MVQSLTIIYRVKCGNELGLASTVICYSAKLYLVHCKIAETYHPPPIYSTFHHSDKNILQIDLKAAICR